LEWRLARFAAAVDGRERCQRSQSVTTPRNPGGRNNDCSTGGDMRIRRIVRSLAVAVLLTSAACADALAAPGACPNDSKLLNGGPTRISGEGPGTWWGLVVNGLVSAGFLTQADQIDYLNEIFDTDQDTLADLKAYNLQLVSDVWDGNHNGYVCAFQLRGTRAYYHNPYLDLTFFGVTDDRVAKK
jgi:hypothetical protein